MFYKNNKIFKNKINMFRYLLANDPKKSPGLPIYKIKLKYDKNSNIEKRMNKSAIDLSKDTELLVLGNNYLSEKDKNKKNRNIPPIRQNKKDEKLILNFANRKKLIKKSQTNLNKQKKNNLTLAQKFLIKAKKDFLTQKLKKIKQNEKNTKKVVKLSSMKFEQNKNNNNNIYNKNKENNYINKNLDESTQRTNNSKIFNKTAGKDKVLMHRLFYRKKNSTYSNIRKLTSMLKDTNNTSMMIEKVLKNYSQDTSFKNYHQKILEKSLKQSKSQDELMGKPEMNMREIFDKNDSNLDHELKQVKSKKGNNINKLTWVKKSTANLIDFGQLSQSMNDEQFYKERRRIIGNYRNYEKEADIYIKKLKNEKPNFKSIVGYNNLKKIDELLEQNSQLIKNIYKKYNEDEKN